MAIGEAVGAAVLTAIVSVAVGAASSLASQTAPTRPLPVGQPWAWPLDPQPGVVHGFDPPDQPWLPGHRGVDLRATAGQPVLAPTAGQVSFSGSLAGRGVVVVTHPSGLRSTFEPVTDGLEVGEVVNRGQPVATVAGGPGHCDPASCLHWGVLRDRSYLDPLSFVGRRRMVLLPLE